MGLIQVSELLQFTQILCVNYQMVGNIYGNIMQYPYLSWFILVNNDNAITDDIEALLKQDY